MLKTEKWSRIRRKKEEKKNVKIKPRGANTEKEKGDVKKEIFMKITIVEFFLIN